MYRLTVVAGPGRGTSFKLKEGENTVGRQLGNAVVLPSSQVSKRHCVLVASGGEILVRDEGSANGTFVNGMLTRNKKVQAGDRIAVGDFVLELSGSGPKPAAAPGANDANAVVPGYGKVFQLPNRTSSSALGNRINAQIEAMTTAAASTPQAPKDLKSKLQFYLENYLMPIFYGMNLKQEWKFICVIVFAGFLALNLVISVQPLLDANRMSVLRATEQRAAYMAKEIAERNTPAIAAGAETKTDIGIAEKARGVRVAFLTDLDLRILAPAQKMNQVLGGGPEGKFASFMANEFRNKGRETGWVQSFSDLVIAADPIKVIDPKKGKNVVAAMVVVSIDASEQMLTTGEAAVVYSETFILTAALGALMLFILYRLTLKPFQVLNEDMDKALKGELAQVTHEFKCEELNPLWDLINSALQRIPRSAQSTSDITNAGIDDGKPEQFVGPLKTLGEAMRVGVVICGATRKVAYMNGLFEELSGIRADSAFGQDLSSVARDQSFGVLIQDLLDRAQVGGDGVVEDYEFSGIACQVYASAFGSSSDVNAKSYMLAVVKKAE